MDFMELIQAFKVYKREKYLDILDAIKKGNKRLASQHDIGKCRKLPIKVGCLYRYP